MYTYITKCDEIRNIDICEVSVTSQDKIKFIQAILVAVIYFSRWNDVDITLYRKKPATAQ